MNEFNGETPHIVLRNKSAQYLMRPRAVGQPFYWHPAGPGHTPVTYPSYIAAKRAALAQDPRAEIVHRVEVNNGEDNIYERAARAMGC